MKNKPLLRSTALAALGLLVGAGNLGCPSPKLLPPSPPAKLVLQGEGMPILNQDPQGESMSVVVHLYQLKDKADFQKLTFEQLVSGRADAELFPQDLLARKEVVVVPGAKVHELVDLHPQTRFLGLVGHFRKPDTYAWRQMANIDILIATATAAQRLPKPKKGEPPAPAPSPVLMFKADQCFLTLANTPPVPLAGQPEGAKPECKGVVQSAPPPADPVPAPPTPPAESPSATNPSRATPEPNAPKRPAQIPNSNGRSRRF